MRYSFLPCLKIHCLVIWLLGFTAFIPLLSCHDEIKKNKSHAQTPDASIEKGKALSVIYCQSCHLLPDPSQADADTWENGVLPAMGPRLGIYAYGFQKYPSYKNDRHTPPGYYPAQPVVNSLQWQNIIDYYTAVAPDTMPAQPQHDTISMALTAFSAQYSSFSYPSPAISYTGIDTAKKPGQLLLFDLSSNALLRFNHLLQLTDSTQSAVTITNIDFHKDSMLACNIGVINPNNGKFGTANLIQTNKDHRWRISTTPLFDSLARPVHTSACDLNNDGKTDYLVCEFGNLSGSLSWMEKTAAGTYTRHVLKADPGAIQTYVEDVNHDGLQDIWALFSQGNEEIVLFTNKGNGKFDQQQVLRFPSIYGSTCFELADFNKDGLQDIIYTCGDNADYSLILKPYHGVYIYLNKGNNNFVQQYFFPINGCYKALARDFDNDGDLDIATISFFTDFLKQPQEGFVYLENKGNYIFTPSTLPECTAGRWLTMDAGDLDGDGKIDLVLGNFSIRPSQLQPHTDWQKGPPFIFLKNITK